MQTFQSNFDEFPFVVCDDDGVVDRVATIEEAKAYLAEMPGERLTFYDSREDVAAKREP